MTFVNLTGIAMQYESGQVGHFEDYRIYTEENEYLIEHTSTYLQEEVFKGSTKRTGGKVRLYNTPYPPICQLVSFIWNKITVHFKKVG
jgi:hypothetical protein